MSTILKMKMYVKFFQISSARSYKEFIMEFIKLNGNDKAIKLLRKLSPLALQYIQIS
jgi:hypothetical protein